MHKENDRTRSCISKARILVVDDESHVAETLRDVLEYQGFATEIAQNGKEALDRLMGGVYFDLIITDMVMPEMDGLELLKHVRQLNKDLPVIVLTGYADFERGFAAIKEGVSHFMSKPFSVRLLIDAVDDALKRPGPDQPQWNSFAP
jgi:DNA-binding NtrC family response regulator